MLVNCKWGIETNVNISFCGTNGHYSRRNDPQRHFKREAHSFILKGQEGQGIKEMKTFVRRKTKHKHFSDIKSAQLI